MRIDATTDPNALDTNVHIDLPNRIITVEQRSDRFALKADTVRLPFDVVRVLGAQVTLADAGLLQATQSGVDVNGEGKTADVDAARSTLRLN